MDHLRRLQRIYRYEAPAKFAYKGGLVLLVIMWTVVLLVPSWHLVFSRPDGFERADLLRAACATASTVLIVIVAVRDFRGHRPFNRSWSFVAAMALLLASMLLPHLV